MKIPFTLDAWLKDKSQRVETKSGKPARIICTDFSHKGYPVVAAINYDGHEEIELYNITGGYGAPREHNFMDLVFVAPEPELSEFEMKLSDIVGYAISYSVVEPQKPTGEFVKEYAAELLATARKELEPEIKSEALKDLPRWRKWETGACGNGRGIPIAIVKRGLGYELVDALGITGEQYIILSDLEKLPKED